MNNSAIPVDSYGISLKSTASSPEEKAIEQITRAGYAVMDAGFDSEELNLLSQNFNSISKDYINQYSNSLNAIGEQHTIRALLAQPNSQFIKVATNPKLLQVISGLIHGSYILNQQNGVINPPGEKYNQGSWHRDLPYQHFVSSRPLAINALFCIDDFTIQNGATFVLPGSHFTENFPSESYIQENAVQITAKAGSYILLNCMVFHSGGFNYSASARRAVNQVYTIPYFRQQINLLAVSNSMNLSNFEKKLLGYGFSEPQSVESYFSTRKKS